ncbi:retrovirus-related pol polyprotein from transposon 297 family protein [Tanacetum coccineum]
MVTNQGMRVAINLTSNKIINNKAPTNKGYSNTKITVKVQAIANNPIESWKTNGAVGRRGAQTRRSSKLSKQAHLNPKHKPCGPEHVNMVTSLRNGKTYNNDIKIPSVHDFSHDVEDFLIDDEIVVEGKKADNVKSDSELVNDLLKDFPKPLSQNPKATESPKGPYSEDMWETFKQVKINLPLIDAIKQIPAYSKFLKDLCTQKRKMKATLPKKIDLTENVSAVLSSFLPPKFKDPGAPLISVVVGNIAIKKAFLDLGASINILPASLVDNTGRRIVKLILETFKQVKINLPFIDAIKQIPAYVKFLKDLCTQKKKLKVTLPKKIDLTEHVSAVLSSSLPPKFKDPRASLFLVVVGNIAIKKALLDLGASINILPASLVDKYDLGTLHKTDTIIYLADRSTKIPRGILEDVIMKVYNFYYLVDFFVIDTESPYKDVQPTIILG